MSGKHDGGEVANPEVLESLLSDYSPPSVPTQSDCCTPETLADKVAQVDQAYGE